MGNYDRAVFQAKDAATKFIFDLSATLNDRLEPGRRAATAEDAAQVVDNLNKAWDELTDALVRQREERGKEVLRLLDELAEAKRTR